MTNIETNICNCISRNVEDKLSDIIWGKITDETKGIIRKIRTDIWRATNALEFPIWDRKNNLIKIKFQQHEK